MLGQDTPWFPHKVFPLSGDCSHAAQAANSEPHLPCWPCLGSGHCLHVLWAGTLCVAPALNWEGNIFPYFLCPLWTSPLWNMCCIVGFVVVGGFFFSPFPRNWLEIDIFHLIRSFKIHPQELCGFLTGMGTLIKKKTQFNRWWKGRRFWNSHNHCSLDNISFTPLKCLLQKGVDASFETNWRLLGNLKAKYLFFFFFKAEQVLSDKCTPPACHISNT